MKAGNTTSDPSDKQPPEPYKVFNEFFERYDLRECQEELWRLLSAAISSEDADHWDKHDRGNAVYFCGNLDKLLKALFDIQEQLIKEIRHL